MGFKVYLNNACFVFAQEVRDTGSIFNPLLKAVVPLHRKTNTKSIAQNLQLRPLKNQCSSHLNRVLGFSRGLKVYQQAHRCVLETCGGQERGRV